MNRGNAKLDAMMEDSHARADLSFAQFAEISDPKTQRADSPPELELNLLFFRIRFSDDKGDPAIG
jgi:hypothetical protein